MMIPLSENITDVKNRSEKCSLGESLDCQGTRRLKQVAWFPTSKFSIMKR